MNGPVNISKMTIENLRGFIYPAFHIDGEDQIHGKSYGKTTRYLVPFRLYKFQICGTINGEWDLGSSEVKRFRDIVEFSNDPAYELKKEICCCLNDYMNTSYGNPGRLVRYTFDGQMFRTGYIEERDEGKDITETYPIEDIPQLDEFIDETINSVKREYKIA